VLVSDAIVKAYRESAIKPIGWGTPTDTELDEGLYRLNALWKVIRAQALGEVVRDWQLPNKLRTAPHNADNIAQFYPQNLNGFNQPGGIWNDQDDTGGGSVNQRQHYPPINVRIVCGVDETGHTLWFPQYPYDGSRMEIVANPAMTEAVDLSGNGRAIEGAETYTFNPGDQPRQWLYRADTANWVSIGGDLALEDELPLPSEFDDFFVCGVAIRLTALDRIDPQQPTIAAYNAVEKKIYQRYYQPGIMSYGGQNAVPSFQSYNNYWGWGTNFRSGV
jgi:hypothetical protein